MNKNSRRLILFGAGASAGSEYGSPYCPPLGGALFEKLQAEYPSAWGAIPTTLRSNFVTNFELGMEELWSSGSHDTATLMQCLADYFSRFRPTGSNTYTRLLEYLQSYDGVEGTFFSTLNYDCMFEYAGRARDFTIDYEAREPSQTSVLSVSKIHGSCNFLPVDIQFKRGGGSYNPAGIHWDGRVAIVDTVQVPHFLKESVLYPAMAVFMRGKPIHANQSFLKGLQQQWTNRILEVEKIGIIGVNPNPEDGHIWDPLSKADAELIIVGDRQKYELWSTSCSTPRKMKFIGEKFAETLPEFSVAFTS